MFALFIAVIGLVSRPGDGVYSQRGRYSVCKLRVGNATVELDESIEENDLGNLRKRPLLWCLRPKFEVRREK
jgi:hypothetical protein